MANNPLGSRDPQDFLLNVGNLDEAMNSNTSEKWLDRPTPDKPATERWTWKGIEDRAQVQIDAAEQAKIAAEQARDDAMLIAETLAAVRIYSTYAQAEADLPNLDDGDNVEINQDETTDGLRTRYVVVSGSLSDKTILSTVVTATSTPIDDTSEWGDVPQLVSTPSTIAAALNTALQKLAKRTRFLRNFSVLKTSATGSAHIPAGPTSARDSSPEIGYIRFNTESGQPEIYNGNAWVGFGASGEMFEIIPYNGPAEYMPIGSIPANGQTFYAALYPEAVAEIDAGKQFAVPDAQWLAGLPGNPDAYKGCWSLGGTDENGRWYRAPDLNGVTGVAPFLRGATGAKLGITSKDTMRRLQGYFTSNISGQGIVATGVFKEGSPIASDSGSTNQGMGRVSLDFDSAGGLPEGHTGTEFAPWHFGVIMCIRMFGAVSNPGSVDAAQLATDLAIANAKIQAVEFGYGDEDVSASRLVSVAYQVQASRSRKVSIKGSGASVIQVSQDGSTWINKATVTQGVDMIVPASWYYRVNGAATVSYWTEG